MSTEPNKPDPKDIPINFRMLVAFALTGLVIFGTPYFYKAHRHQTAGKDRAATRPGRQAAAHHDHARHCRRNSSGQGNATAKNAAEPDAAP